MLRGSHISTDRRGGSVGKRRNGLQPACENCRKAKVRCDITSSETACARCRKRKNPWPCVFLEAPMTRTRLDAPLQKATSPSPSQSQSTSPSLSTDHPRSSHNISTTSAVSSKKSPYTPGYLGSTSYNATLQHSELSPSDDDIDGYISKADPYEVSLGVDILRHLPDEKTCHMLDFRNHLQSTFLVQFSLHSVLLSNFLILTINWKIFPDRSLRQARHIVQTQTMRQSGLHPCPGATSDGKS
jgi:hypothetical protein